MSRPIGLVCLAVRDRPTAVLRDRLLPGKLIQCDCFATAARASLSCFQLGAYLSASSYLAMASCALPCFKSTSPQALTGSAQCGPRCLASWNLDSAASNSPCFASASPNE